MSRESLINIALTCGLSFIMMFIVGASVGFPGLLPILLNASVYGDLCNITHDVNCSEIINTQLSMIASTTLTTLNAVGIIQGLIIDIVGTRVLGIVGVVSWIGFTICSGLAPQKGWPFFLGFMGSSVSSTFIFFAIIADYGLGLSPANFPVLVPSLLTGFWDLGSFTDVLLRFVYFSVPNMELYVLYTSYACIIGIPSLIFLICCFPPEISLSRNSFDWSQIKTTIKDQFIDTLNMLKTRVFWGYVCACTSVVGYGYFIIPNIVPIMKWNGADDKTAEHYNFVFAILLPSIGALGSIFCAFCVRFDRKITLCLVVIIQVILITGFIIITEIDGPLWIQYIGFILFVLWRMNGFVIINTLLPITYEGSIGLNKAWGIIYTISGVIGLVVDRIMTGLISQNLNSLLYINIGMYLFAAITSILFALAFWFDLDDNCHVTGYIPKTAIIINEEQPLQV